MMFRTVNWNWHAGNGSEMDHESVEITVKKRDHMCSAESPQVRKVNTNSQRETGESGCRLPSTGTVILPETRLPGV